jgi:AcrR family transcriptional regulator
MPLVEEPPARGSHRARLLEGLAESIREKGLQGTQVSDIVRHARTSRRTFYECFADKDACFLALIGELFESVQAEMQGAVDSRATWTTQIDQAIDSLFGALARDPALTVTISRELPALGVRGAEVHRQRAERYAQIVLELRASAERQQVHVPPISIETAVMLVGGIGELVDRAIYRGEDLRSLAPVAKDVLKAVLDPARRPIPAR